MSTVILGLHIVGVYWALTHASLPNKVEPMHRPSSIAFEFTAPLKPQVSAPGPVEPKPAPATNVPEQKPVTPKKPVEPKKKVVQKKPVEKALPTKPAPSTEPAVAAPAPAASAPAPSGDQNANAAKPAGTGGEQLSTIPAQVGRFQANNPDPAYPMQARRRHMEGLVILSVRVNEDGRVADVRVKTSSGYELLDGSAIDTVRHWQFEPGRRGSTTASTVTDVRINFRLN